MKSLHLGTYWGIPVKVHWSFYLLFLFIIGVGLMNGLDAVSLLYFGLFIILMFTCVVLHEYGHALTAKRFGVDTVDIIISPIGGIARLKKLPEQPVQELKIAIAGPLVNLTIAVLLFLLALLTIDVDSFVPEEDSLKFLANPAGFLVSLIWINVVLFVFNLVPAFPMDGGRILRAILSMNFGIERGTRYASIVGRILAIVFVVFGLVYQHIMLVLIGGFVFLMARAEQRQVTIKSRLNNFVARDIMKTTFNRLHLSTGIRELYEHYIRGGERNYVVVDSLGNLSGVISEEAIKEAINSGDLDRPVSMIMKSQLYIVPQDMKLYRLYEEMNVRGEAMAIIKNGDQVLGIIDRQMLFNFVQLKVGN